MEPRCISNKWNVGVFEKMEPRCIRVILDYILTSASLNLNFGYIYGFFYKIVGFYESNVLRFFQIRYITRVYDANGLNGLNPFGSLIGGI